MGMSESEFLDECPTSTIACVCHRSINNPTMKQYQMPKCYGKLPNAYISERPRPLVPDHLMVDYKLSTICPTVLDLCDGDVRVVDTAGRHLATWIVNGWDHLFVTERERKCVQSALLQLPKMSNPTYRSAATELQDVSVEAEDRVGKMYYVGPYLRGTICLFQLPNANEEGKNAFLGRFRQLLRAMAKLAEVKCPKEWSQMMTTLSAQGSSKTLSEIGGEELPRPNLGVTLGQWPKAHRDKDYQFGMFVVLDPKGPVSGGQFALPEYGFALGFGHGDVVLFDPKQLHCCCETWSSNG